MLGDELKSFAFFRSYYEAAQELPDEQRLALYDAILRYAFDNQVPELNGLVKTCFTLIKLSLDVSIAKAKSGRSTEEYKEWRASVLARDNFMCQSCGITKAKLNAHHIKRFRNDIGGRTDIDNGMTLCERCHIELHSQEGK